MHTLQFIAFALACGCATGFAELTLRGITYDQPVFGGNGCPPGSVHVAANEDNTTLSILFDSFNAQTKPTELRFVRKACNVAIPLRVPPGFHVTLHTIDFRGYSSVPEGSGTFKADYFFAGSLTKAWTMKFGPDNANTPANDPFQQYFPDGDFTYRSNVVTLVPNAACYDRNAILRLALTQSVNSKKEALVQLDSLDMNRKNEIVYSLELVSGDCSGASASASFSASAPVSFSASGAPRRRRVST